MDADDLVGLVASLIAAVSFGSYGVPMKGEASTRVDVDPLVFQTYKAVTVFATSAILICINNYLAKGWTASTTDEGEPGPGSESYFAFHEWTFADFTPWAYVSALLWIPGGTAGVYAIRRAGLAVSVGVWSCVIVVLSFVWGVLIFGEEQRSALGAVAAVAVLCAGLCGIAYFSSVEVNRQPSTEDEGRAELEKGGSTAGETTPLVAKGGANTNDEEIPLDLVHFPHSGTHPHSHQTVDLHVPFAAAEERTFHVSKYHIGLFMAVVNGVLAATIMVPLHYAPPNTTRGVGYSMSFGIAAVLVVALFWALRFMFLSICIFVRHSLWSEFNSETGRVLASQMFARIINESLTEGYRQLPSFHVRVMWRPGLTSGVLYSMGNLSGIVSIQKLGDFMGYSLNQSSIIVSGLWGIFYYREIPGVLNMIGFLTSCCIVFGGIILMASEHKG
ncbi:hypothetical protein ACHAWF_002611 [Thalassiosira exigua]